MYARTTLLEIDTLRSSVDETLAEFTRDVVPAVEQQPGFQGLFAFTTPEGKAMLITLWDTAAQADADSQAGFYAGVLARFATVFRAPPGRERYEVRLARLHEGAVA